MKHYWKRTIVSVLVVALVATLCLSCGGSKGEGKVTITIGEITDLTGAGSPALKPLHYGIVDLAAYYNENNLIPGVKIKIATYDDGLDPSRDLAGYDWLKGRGAKLIINMMAYQAQTIETFAERDGVSIASLSVTNDLIEPPGWVLCFSPPLAGGMVSLAGWLTQHDTDFPAGRPAKIGFAGWDESNSISVMEGLKTYCQDNPEKFEWMGDFLEPTGTMDFTGVARQLKDCDYVATFGSTVVSFLRDYRAMGCKGKLIDINCTLIYQKLFLDSCGWKAVNGTIAAATCPLWTESLPLVDLARECLYKYHSGEAADIVASGYGYLGAFQNVMAIFDVVAATVEQVGVKNFDGQSFNNVAINYTSSTGGVWQGIPQWGFSEARRYAFDHVKVWEWDAQTENLVALSDWFAIE
jgi:hypothetical protein